MAAPAALSRALILATRLFALQLALGAAQAEADALPAQGLYDTCRPASSPDGCPGRGRRSPPETSTTACAASWTRSRPSIPTIPASLMVCGVCGHDPAGWSDLDIAVGRDANPAWTSAQRIGRLRLGQPDREASAGCGARPGRQRLMALQAWRYGDSHLDSEGLEGAASTRFPTSEEITANPDAAIGAANPGLILWFTLWDVIGWDGNQRPWYWRSPPIPTSAGATSCRAPLPSAGPTPGRPPPPAADHATTPLAHRPSGASASPRRQVDAAEGKGVARHIRQASLCLDTSTVVGSRVGRRCALRARRSGAHRIALLVDDGDRCAAAHKRLCIAKSAHGGRR